MQISHGAGADLMTAPTTQSSVAMTELKEHILRENLQPGDSLPTESRLCEDIGVSRSSVREAVRTLVALDIVEVRHGHGMFVGRASARPIVESLVFRGRLNQVEEGRALLDIIQVRAALDQAVADLVVAAWEGTRDTDLDEAVAQMDSLAQKGRTFSEPDRRFHLRLLDPLDNQLVRHLSDALWTAQLVTASSPGSPSPATLLRGAQVHRRMLEAARAGDLASYLEALARHYALLTEHLTTVGRSSSSADRQ